MLFSWIELRNIRSYESSRIEFSKGISLLSGDIGSGKSTILQAIEFALFGLLRGDLEGQALLRHSQNKGSVTLGLSIAGQEVVIHRALIKTKNGISQETGWMSTNGMQTQYSATELKSQILQLLNYPLDSLNKSKSLIYRYTVYTSQDQMKNIIAESAPMRLQTLRVLFGVDKYKLVSENAQITIKELKEQIALCEGKESQLTQSPALLAQVSLQVNTLKQSLQIQEFELKKTLEQKEETEQKRAHVDAQIQIVQEKKELFATLAEKRASIQKQDMTSIEAIQKNTLTLTAVKSRIEELEETKKSEQIHEVSEEEFQKAQAQYAAMQENVKNLTSDISQLQLLLQQQHMLQSNKDKTTEQLLRIKEQIQAYESVKSDIAAAPANLTKIILEYESTLQDCAKMQAMLDQASQKAVDITQLDACPVCEQKIPHEHKEKIHAQHEIQRSTATKNLTIKKQQLKDLSTQRDQLQVLVKKTQEDAARLVMLRNRETELTNEISKIKIQNVSEIERHIAQKKDSLTTAQAIQQNIQKTLNALQESILKKNKQLEQALTLTAYYTKRDALSARIEELQNVLEQNKLQIQHLNEQIDELQIIICQHDILNTERQALQVKLNQISVMYLQQHESVTRTRADLNHANESIALHQIAVAELHRVQEKITQLRTTKTFLETQFLPIQDVCEQQILATVHNQFSHLLDEWFQILLEDNSLSIRLDESFAPIITQNGYEVSVSALSGGEQTSVALAYRLALNRVISHVITSINTKGVIILDEPTDGFSTEQLDRVRTVLQRLQIPQILIVSHEQKIESFVDKIIRITKKENISVALTAKASDELSHQYP